MKFIPFRDTDKLKTAAVIQAVGGGLHRQKVERCAGAAASSTLWRGARRSPTQLTTTRSEAQDRISDLRIRNRTVQASLLS